MRRLLVMLAVVLLSACSRGQDGRNGRIERDEVLVQVLATGRAEVRPDEARMTVGVDTIAPTSGAASTQNTATSNRVIAALEKLGVKPADVQTRALTLSRIDYGPRRGAYSATNVVEIRIKDVARAGEAVAAATAAGGNVVSGPALRVGNPDAADNAAYAAAYRSARTRADAYAAAAGLKVERILAIRDAAAQGMPIDYSSVAAEQTSMVAPPPVVRSSPPVRAGIDTREASVRVDFALSKLNGPR